MKEKTSGYDMVPEQFYPLFVKPAANRSIWVGYNFYHLNLESRTNQFIAIN